VSETASGKMLENRSVTGLAMVSAMVLESKLAMVSVTALGMMLGSRSGK
jgi:hypothetical protein